MATEYVASIAPQAWSRADSPSGLDCDPLDFAPNGNYQMLRLPKSDAGYTTLEVIPANLTMGTGLTLKIPVTDDGRSSTDLGKVARIGVTVKLIASGTDNTAIATSAGTEQTVDVTLNATSGVIVIGSLAIASANLDSAAVAGLILIRIRRVGTASQDTLAGNLLVGKVYILNT